MSSLEAAQHSFITTLENGPTALDPNLFDGPAERVLLGIAAHANTISHTRLVALEDTFPLTLQRIGAATFNTLCRDYIETDMARAATTSYIGAGFPDFLPESDIVAKELAQIEWAWLQSYHAPEASPLSLSELAGIDEAALLTFGVARHPSARCVEITVPLSPQLETLAEGKPAAVLALRPDAEVILLPLCAAQLAVFKSLARKNAVLGNLLSAALEIFGDTAPLGPVMDLISAGALVRDGTR